MQAEGGKGKPHLVVLPRVLMQQSIGDCVVMTGLPNIAYYCSDGKSTYTGPGKQIKDILTKDSKIFKAADSYRTIVFTTKETIAIRNGLTAQAQWRMKIKQWSHKEAHNEYVFGSLDPEFPRNIAWMF